MRKIPTLFLRDENDRRYVTREVNPEAAWVLDGEGVATRKFDGTCVLLDAHGQWWARRQVKLGQTPPMTYMPVETDPMTGNHVGWEPIAQSPFFKVWHEVISLVNAGYLPALEPGTYELCGPKINRNPEGYTAHLLIRHSDAPNLGDVPRDYDGLVAYMTDLKYEGIVWHHPDGRMAKLKRRDFPRLTGSPQAPTSSAG